MSRLLAAQRALTVPGWVKDELWRRARATPSLDLRFAEGKSLVDATTGQNLVTFTRASGGTYVDSQGVIRNATTNLLLRSAEINDAAWLKFTTTVSPNVAISPDGSQTADNVIPNAVAGLFYVSQTVTTVVSTVYTFSFYAKANGFSWVFADAFDGTNRRTWFNLANGTLGTVAAGTTAAISAAGNGWYRCSISLAAGAASIPYAIAVTSANNVFTGVTGNGVNGVLVWGAQLEQSSTVGEYIPTGATINSAPRFDHNPTTGESLGLLVEEQRTNLLLRSEEFDNASWSKNNTSITANTVAAPNGTASADSLIENSASTEHSCVQTFTAVSGTAYTLSVFVKSLSGNRAVKLRFTTTAWTGSVNTQVDFNLTTGAGTIITGSPTFTSQAFPGGWWRFSMTTTSTANGTPGAGIHLIESVGSVISYTGDNASGIYIWGAQLEAGAFPTSYIPTTTAAATRSADVASISGSNFSSWYRQDESSVFLDCRLLTGSARLASTTRSVFDVSDGTSDNRLIVRAIVNNTLSDNVTVRSNGGTSFNVTTGVTVDTAARKLSAAFKANDTAFVSTGASNVATGDTGAMPIAASQLNIGGVVTLVNANFLSGHIARIAYWPQRLGNEVLQRITQ